MSAVPISFFGSSPARIVALGESVHGSATLHRLILNEAKALISTRDQEKAFRFIGFEIPTSAGEALNESCLYGDPDSVREALELSYRIFRSPAYLEFFLWLQTENSVRAQRGDPVIEIYGFDIRDVWVQRLKILGNPHLSEKLTSRTAKYLEGLTKEEYYRLEWAALKGQLSDEELQSMKEVAAEIGGLSDAGQTHEAAARSVSEMLTCLSSSQGNYFELNQLRDAAMARNVSRHADSHHGRSLLIGHLTHLSELSLDQQIPEVTYRSPKGMGQVLREKYGQDYACFGFSFQHGRYVRPSGDIVEVRASQKSIESICTNFENGIHSRRRHELPKEAYFGHFEIVGGNDEDDSRDPLRGPLEDCLSGIVISQTSEAFQLP